MKLFTLLSLIAYVYADKLDRTYLPPSSAASAGGSPGSLNTPTGPSSSGFGQPSGTTGFGQPARFGPSNGSGFGKSTSGPAFGAQPSGFGAPSGQYGQPGAPAGSLDPGFSQVAQNFGGKGSQDYQRNQPQRAQASAEQNAEILRLDNENDGETFSYAFETSNGIAAEESGVATNGVQAQGAFSYSGDDGQAYRVTYTADENGYQPQGDHLPTPHPIPEEILKSIEQNAQAAAAGTQEGAYNPNEDSISLTAQQYSQNAPTSYDQGPSGSSSYNQAQGNGPNQLYGGPSAGGVRSRPQSGGQGLQPQGPSQQYGAPNIGAPSSRPNTFGKLQTPSQLYGSTSNGAPASGFSGASQGRPNSFGQPQGPSMQYSGISRPGSSGASNGFVPSGTTSNGFFPPGTTSNGFVDSGPSTQPKPSQYQAPSQPGFPSAGSKEGPTQGGQGQGDSGYKYDRPQGSSFGQGPSGRPSSQGPAGQYRPQNGAPQALGPQTSFPRPNSNNAGYPSGPAQGSSGPLTATSSQGSPGFFSGPKSGIFGPSASSKGPSSFGSSSGPTGQGSFGSGPNGSGSFSPSTGASGPSSFGPSASANGFGRSQGSFPGAGNQGGMTNSGYTYNRPGSQSGSRPQQPQRSSNAPGSGPGQNFGGPRQPPSFSEEEGYKY